MVAAHEPDLELREILAALPYGVLVVDGHWRVTFANAEANRVIGREGTTLWERCPTLEATAFGTAFRYAMADRAELISETALPSVGWIQARARPLGDGLLIALRSVVPDASESLQTRQALLVAEVAVALTRAGTLRDMLRGCVEALTRQLDVKLARVWTLDTAQHELVLQASSGLEPPDMPDRVAIGRAKIGKIAERGTPLYTNDFANDPRAGNRAWAQREGLVAFAGYPLRMADTVLGVLAVYGDKPFGADTRSSLAVVADSIALGVQRKLSEDAREAVQGELRTQAEQLEMINEIGKLLTTELEIGPLAHRVINLATRLANAGWGAFYMDGDDDHLTLLAASGTTHKPLPTEARKPQLLASTFADVATTASFHIVPVTARGGRPIGTLVFGHEHAGVFTEATERLLDGVAAQAAIAIDNARLFEDARGLIDKLEKKNAELDQVAYVASHDLKAPLRGIANLSQWIEDDLGDKMDEQARYHMGLLRGRVTRLESLIEGILSYSRVGRTDGQVADIDTSAFVRELWELLAPPESADLVVGDLPPLRTQRVPLQQVFMNLMGNAVKYNPSRALRVEVGARAEGNETAFFVKDDGVGIPREFHDRIWGLFQTLEARDKVESTGIGLAVVRKIVESRGGRTWVDSAAGAGATFWFTWPEVTTRTRHVG